jgi:hypothetical protein
VRTKERESEPSDDDKDAHTAPGGFTHIRIVLCCMLGRADDTGVGCGWKYTASQHIATSKTKSGSSAINKTEKRCVRQH